MVLNYFFFSILSGVRLSPLGTTASTRLSYQPQMIDDCDCGAVGGMTIGRVEIFGESQQQRHFLDNKSHMTKPGLERGPPRWKGSD
jgi:hypothetical protein